MTTPNQLPIDRAYVIGGETADPTTDTSYPGNNFGQNFTEYQIRSLFEIPVITLLNVVEVFTDLLLRLPLEALKVFEPIIPGGLENFTDVVTAVDAIVGSLTEVVTMLPMTVFQAFLDIVSGDPGAAVEAVADLIKGGLDSLQELVHGLLGILGIDIEGTFLDNIFDLVDGLDAEFLSLDGLLGSFDDLLGIFGGTGGLAGADNFVTNLLSIFNLGGIGDITGDPGAFDPLEILENIPLLGQIIEALSSIFGIFGGSGSGLGSFTGGLGSMDNVITNLLSIFSLGGIGDLSENPGTFDPIGAGVEIISDLVPDLPDLQNVIKNGLDGLSGLFGGWGNLDIADSLSAMQQNTASLAATVNELKTTKVAENNSGVSALEAFEYTNTSSLDTSLWDQDYLQGSVTQGVIAVVDGHNAGIKVNASGAVEQLCRFKGTNHTTLTNYQSSKVVVHERMNPGTGTAPYISVYCRANAARTQWVRADFTADGFCKFYYKNGGAVTHVGTDTTIINPGVGARLEIRPGTTGGLRVYQALINEVVVNEWTDGSSVTAVGSSNAEGGFGMFQVNGSNSAGKVTQYMLADYSAVPVLGSTIGVYRSSTSGITKSGGGDAPLPNNTMDTVDYATPDMHWNAATSSLTIDTPGTYQFACRYTTNKTSLGFDDAWESLFYKNGTVKRRGEQVRSISANGFGVPALSTDRIIGGGGVNFYCESGTVVRPGLWSYDELTFIGDAGGTTTWFSAVKIS